MHELVAGFVGQLVVHFDEAVEVGLDGGVDDA